MDSPFGSIYSALNSTVVITSLFGVIGILGMPGEVPGIVPVLNLAAGITILTGLIALLFLPAKAWWQPGTHVTNACVLR